MLLNTLLLSLFLLKLFLSAPVLAFEVEGIPMVLSAEQVQFNHSDGSISATGNVRIVHDAYRIESSRFFYDGTQRRLTFPDPVTVDSVDRYLNARSFDYDFKAQSGEMTSVNATVDGLSFSGNRLLIDTEKSELLSPTLTSCDCEDGEPDYKIDSRSLTLYPKTGDVVSRGNSVSFYGAKLLYFPTFIYSRSHSSQTVHQSIPEFGHNQVDGTFGRLHYAYFFKPESTGTFSVGSSVKRGAMVGATHRFLLNNRNRLIIKGYTVNETGPEGGVVFESELFRFKDPNKKERLFEQLFSPFVGDSDPKGIFVAEYLHNEFIAHHLVHLKPQVSFRVENLLFPFGARFDGMVSRGTLSDKTITSSRDLFYSSIRRDFALSDGWNFQLASDYKGHHYGNEAHWERLLGKASLGYYQGWFQPELSYTRLLYKRGASPFSFERVNAVESDEVGVGASMEIGMFLLKSKADYNVDTGDLRSVVYTLGLMQDCWQISFHYDSVWEEGRIGFSLR